MGSLILALVWAACGGGGTEAGGSDGGPDAAIPDAGPPRDPDPFVEVAAGAAHTCARRESGEVWCWGLNNRGQLGDGTRRSRGEPRPVAELDDAVRPGASTPRSRTNWGSPSAAWTA